MSYEYFFISDKNTNTYGVNTAETFKVFFVELLSGYPIYMYMGLGESGSKLELESTRVTFF
jgi:hypothetical protein